ncbi:MAG TPA: Ig-like domain-containing protein [Gemmatimonadaceae bacterium]|nr:Ig-like domain-containing protein [Gemmatimonadaceae bacterium]
MTIAIGTNPAAGTLGGTVSATAVSGVATFANLSINNAGAGYTLTASSSGLTSATSAAFNIGTPAVASTVVSPHLDTLTAIGATFALGAQARDAAANPVAGTFTWVSRAPGVATVSASGSVTAVANGSTWVVATEAGGTRDSAQVVVFQKLATINVTPNPRNVYLGASYQFTASAVDGLGVALASQPAFTWSTLSGAVASVSAAGVATGTGLGSTQVRATSGAVTGVAQINVLTPITRVVVSRDSAGFPTTKADTFTLAALGRTRSYVATARDTLDNPMTGITFSWTSSNGAVASLDSINTATVRATAAANGVTSITATAQGISGSAQLTVQQVLTSIDLSPATATIAPTGSVALVARGRDANNFFIPGGSFSYASAQPSVATVGATSGVVTGVANGSASITATSGAITSNTAVVTVGGAVPATISFGRDTLTVGRSGSVSVPVYLSKPFTNAVTVNLAVRDTFAFFATSSVSIPAGQTSGNATLNGHNAGTTQVYATDGGGGGGYAGDTAVLAVQATVRLTNTSYSLNVTDQVSTQVLLSDPAPAGGTYVTFNYGTAGKVNASPDPAFIPAGQLAANVVLLATGANTGGTTVTPAATGVNGTASTVYTYPATLSGTTSVRLGVGQYEPNMYAQASTYFNAPLAVTITSSDSTKVRVPSGMTIGAGSYYNYFTATALAAGTATVTSSATGWTPVTASVTVTTPKVGICCSGTYNTTSPQFGVTVYAEDSTSTSHYRSNALVVSLSSTDTTVLKVLTPTVTIAAGQYYTSSGLVVPGGSGGTARIIASASGHNPDSTGLYTVVGPKLSFSWTSGRVGAGQQDQNLYVSTPNNVTGSPLVVTLANTDSTVLGAPTTITIPVGTYYAYFTVRGKSPGAITMYATAPGYSPDTATYVVSSPLLALSAGGTLNNFAPASGFTVYAADSTRNSHYLTSPVVVSYTSTNPAVLTVTGADTIQAGSYYTNHAVVTPVGVGTAKIIASASGYGPDSATYTVQTPKLSFSWFASRLGKRQFDQNYYVQVPNNRTSNLAVTVTQAQPSVDSLSLASITIPSGTYYTYFNVAGLNTGTDTLIASAPGYLPDTAYVTVTTPKFTSSGLPSNVTTTNPPSTVTVYATDSTGNSHYVLDTVIVKATSSNGAVIQPTAAGFRIPPGGYYGQPQVAYTGPGTASMTYTDSLNSGYQPVTTNTVTVTGPSLSIGNSTTVLGMRQNGGSNSAYVQVPNSITGSALVVSLVSSDPTVAQVPATVTIPVGSYYAYFPITAQDVVGTIQITATATGYGGATTNVQVTQPKFVVSTSSSVNTTSPRQTITVYATDANGTSHYTNEDVVVTLTSSSTIVGTTDSATVTIVAGNAYTQAGRFIPGSAGTTQLSASDARVASYKYSTGTFNVAVNVPTLSLSFSNATLGIGQYDNQTVYTPDYQASALTVNMSHYSGATSTPSSVTIGASAYYAGMKVAGAAAGTDTITYSASGHNPVKGAVTVATGRLDPISGWPGSLNQGDSVLVTIYARDANTNVHYAASATTLSLTPSGKIQFVSGGVGSSPITTAVIPADQQYVQVWLKALTTGSGSGSAQIASTNYSTYVTPTVTVP